MKILVDENIPRITVTTLCELGHEVKDIRQTKLEGISDEALWELCQKEERLLITTDLGFSHNRHTAHFGILIVRLKQPNKAKIHERVIQSIKKIGIGEWHNLLVVAQDRVQRIWRN